VLFAVIYLTNRNNRSLTTTQNTNNTQKRFATCSTMHRYCANARRCSIRHRVGATCHITPPCLAPIRRFLSRYSCSLFFCDYRLSIFRQPRAATIVDRRSRRNTNDFDVCFCSTEYVSAQRPSFVLELQKSPKFVEMRICFCRFSVSLSN
jgi:hypothetical protein